MAWRSVAARARTFSGASARSARIRSGASARNARNLHGKAHTHA